MKKITVLLLILLTASISLFCTSCKTPETELIKIDYVNMTYVGSSLKDFSKMFDEQDALNPLCDASVAATTKQIALDYDANGSIDEVDKSSFFDFTVDLFAEHNVQYIYLYFDTEGCPLTVKTGTPFAYENEFKLDSSLVGWNCIEINGKTRYLDLIFQNGSAPSEVMFYGYRTGEYDKVNEEKHNYKTFDYFLGMNGNLNDYGSKVNRVTCAPYFRDYVNWAWVFSYSLHPNPGTTFSGEFSSKFDGGYLKLNNYLVEPVPCYMFGSEVKLDGVDSESPDAYVMYGELVHQVAVRFGNNPMNTAEMVHLASRGNKRYNRNLLKWIEAGNEPNGEGNDGFTPYELAALTSTAYDGHCSTVKSTNSSGIGVKNADPNMNMAMAGLAGVGTRYIKAMAHWMKFNRADGSLGMDAFNVHTYCRKTEVYNGYTISYGVAPEIGNITGELKNLAEFRDKYYPDTELWLTEFGWDTNTSYETENACHPYGEFSARELQAMWIVRAYFMFAAVGVDRCALYMCSDLGDDATSVGKYGTSGVIAYNGDYKESYYYIYTLRNTMGDMYFAEIIDSGDENVWIYRFENGKGKSCYAVWCPTMDSVEVNGYKLSINGDSAKMVEFEHQQTEGITTNLVVENKTVTVDVSERPILIFSE